MAVLTVNPLEAVEIHKQQPNVLIRAAGAVECVSHAVGEAGAIEQAREWIVSGTVVEFIDQASVLHSSRRQRRHSCQTLDQVIGAPQALGSLDDRDAEG